MKAQRPNIKLIAGVALVLIAGACGGQTTSDAVPVTTASPTTAAVQATATTAPPAARPAPDHAEVNGVSLAYECLGSGSPTVIFEHGWAPPEAAEYHPSWGGAKQTIEALSELTTACVYGRRGVMGSDPVTTEARTAIDQVADLSGFIDSIRIEVPVVLIGYSWGGELVRLFAGHNPEAVMGLVLVDSQHPEADAAFGQETPPPVAPEMIDFPVSHDQVSQIADLGDLPIYLLSSSETFPQAPEEMQKVWDDLQTDLSMLSSNTKSERVEGFSHFDIAGAADEITAAVRDVIERHGN